MPSDVGMIEGIGPFPKRGSRTMPHLLAKRETSFITFRLFRGLLKVKAPFLLHESRIKTARSPVFINIALGS